MQPNRNPTTRNTNYSTNFLPVAIIKKTIEVIIAPPAPHMVGDGFRVHGFFPGGRIDKKSMSPFFLMDYNS